jgi:K+-transporting ATPase A subunit
MIIVIIKFVVVAVAGFVAGLLVGRKNKTLVEKVVANAVPAITEVENKIKNEINKK